MQYGNASRFCSNRNRQKIVSKDLFGRKPKLQAERHECNGANAAEPQQDKPQQALR
jgi:hypothetical protein